MNTKLLRQKILDLAIRGKLTEQKKSDGTTKDLLAAIVSESSTSHSERSAKGAKSKNLAKEITPLDKSEAPFEIPENWEWVRLGDILEKITDGTHHSPINTETGDFLYVTAKNIKDDGISLDDISYVSSDTHNEIYARCNPEKGDVLLIKDGATTGVVTVNTLDEPFSLLSSVALLKPGKHIAPWFLAFVIRSNLFNVEIRSQMKGVGITRVTLAQINTFKIPLPPLAEQQRIVETIENAFAKITAIENNQELLKKHIKQGRQKILDLAIRGKLTQQLKTDGTTQDLLATIGSESSACHAELDSASAVPTACHSERSAKGAKSKNLGKSKKDITKEIIPLDKSEASFEIPENWEWVRLGDICQNIKRGKSPKYTESNSNILVFAQKCNQKNGPVSLEKALYLDESTLGKYPQEEFMQYGDTVINSTGTGTLGRVGYFNVELPKGIDGIVPDSHVTTVRSIACDTQFIYYVVKCNQEYLEGQGEGSTNQKELKPHTINDLPVPLPPLAEQKRIVAAIQESFAEFDAMEKVIQLKL